MPQLQTEQIFSFTFDLHTSTLEERLYMSDVQKTFVDYVATVTMQGSRAIACNVRKGAHAAGYGTFITEKKLFKNSNADNDFINVPPAVITAVKAWIQELQLQR